ncbi:MAG: hypothetical protein AB7V77_02025 [Candidatus Woesearchaeota archaeon]
MTLGTIFTIIVAILLFYLFFKILKSIVKAILSVIVIGIVVIMFFGAFILMDASDFKNDLVNENSIFVLKEGENILTAFQSKGFDFSELSNLEMNEVDENSAGTGRLFVFEEEALNSNEIPLGEKSESWTNILDKIKTSNDSTEKNTLFAASIANKVKEEGPFFVFKKMKDGIVYIYETTPFVKFMVKSPAFLFNFFTNKINNESNI